jgi:tetratricopeptide (TPR) repeat protein
MVATLSPSEEAQLGQTIEMFEVITQSQPLDYQSLEILKEAYSKLGREKEAVQTSKRVAEAYVQLGQLSSAILEYETILQRFPDDPDIRAALAQIESKAGNFPAEQESDSSLASKPRSAASKVQKNGKAAPLQLDDGRQGMQKIFVEGKIITAADFDLCWVTPDPTVPPNGVIEPFLQRLADKGMVQIDKALKILADQSRFAYLPMANYDVDLDLARTFPGETCQRWCVLPFDRMSKLILVATTNPFNQQASKELSEATGNRLLWYLVSPTELIKNVRKAFR